MQSVVAGATGCGLDNLGSVPGREGVLPAPLCADRPCVPLNLLSGGAKVLCMQTGPVSHSDSCPVVPRCCVCRQALCPTQPPVRWCQGVVYADRPCVPPSLLSDGTKVLCMQTGPVSHSASCPMVPRCSVCRQALCPTQPPVRWCQGVLCADRHCVPLNLLSDGAKVLCMQTGPVSHSTSCPVVPRCSVCRQALCPTQPPVRWCQGVLICDKVAGTWSWHHTSVWCRD
jgi:hypothetical protein